MAINCLLSKYLK